MTTNSTAASRFGLFEFCFKSNHYRELFGGESTHDPALKFCAGVVKHTTDEDLICQIVEAGLPVDYPDKHSSKGKTTLDEVRGMVRDAIAKGFDRAESKPKGCDEESQAEVLLGMIRARQDITFFHDKALRPYMSVRDEQDKGPLILPLNSSAAKSWIKGFFYRQTKAAITTYNFTAALDTLQAVALHDSPQKEVRLRMAEFDGKVYINLANDQRQVIEIDREGFRITLDPPITMTKSALMDSQVVPASSWQGALQELQALWGVDDESFVRLLVFMINCLNPNGPYMYLLLEGEQGSGKSVLCALLKLLLDPSIAAKMRFPKEERDLMVMAKETHLLVFDNMSGLSGEMSDALCCLTNGSGFVGRKLYTDEEPHIFIVCCPFILNGIADYVTRPDLIERAVFVNLPSMPEGARKSEAEMFRAFEELRPRVLAQLCEIVSCALRRRDEIEPPSSIRMADAATWIVAAEPATGLPEGTLLRAMEDSQNDLVTARMDSNTLAGRLTSMIETAPHVSHVQRLYDWLQSEEVGRHDKSFPRSSSSFSQALKRLKPGLKKIGVNLEFLPRENTGQKIAIWRDDQAETLDQVQKMWAAAEKARKY